MMQQATGSSELRTYLAAAPSVPQCLVIAYRALGARVWQVWGTSQAPRGWQADRAAIAANSTKDGALTTSQPTPRNCLLRPHDDNLNEHASYHGDTTPPSSINAFPHGELPTNCRLNASPSLPASARPPSQL